MTLQSTPKVTAVVVTYGDRSQFVRQVVDQLRAQECIPPVRVVLVDNGASSRSKAYLAKLQQTDERVSVIHADTNLGSAGGFGIGISEALKEPGCDYVWLLDDDNVPEPRALFELLLAAFAFGSTPLVEQNDAWCSCRRDRLAHARLARGMRPSDVFPLHSSFLGFHFRSFTRRFVTRSWGKQAPVGQSIVQIPLAPYGGLLLPRHTVEAIGLPDERLFTYADDTEYTYRITRAGGAIHLVLPSILIDVDDSWGTGKPRLPFPAQLIQLNPSFRVYFTVRNHTYFSSHFWCHHRWSYLFNRFVFVSTLAILSLAYRRPSRFSLIWGAIVAGERQEFGFPQNLEVPGRN